MVDFYYANTTPPRDPNLLSEWLTREFRNVSAAMQELARGHYSETHVAPDKPRNGDTRYADGTNWDPGDGAGFYRYDGTAWKKLADYSDIDFSRIFDADNDTYVEVEDSANENKIRFGVAGTLEGIWDNDSLRVLNASEVRTDHSVANKLTRKEIRRVAVSAQTTVFTATFTGFNGQEVIARISVNGHTSTQGNWSIIAWYRLNGSNNSELMRKTEGFSSVSSKGTLTVGVASNVFTVDVTSSNGTSTFKGQCTVEIFMPEDFSNNTVAFS